MKDEVRKPGEDNAGQYNSVTINGEIIIGLWDGTAVPYSMIFLKPRHVRALGYPPRKGKKYAIRDGNQLVECIGEYTAWVKTLDLPGIYIGNA